MQVNLDTILYLCGAIVTISAATAIIVKYVKSSVAKISKEIVDQIIKKREEELKVHYTSLVEKLESKIDTRFQDLDNKIEKTIGSMKLMTIEGKRLAINMACIRIDESHAYFSRLGYIPVYEMSLLEDIYADYEALGGNHMAESQMIELRKLPQHPPALTTSSR